MPQLTSNDLDQWEAWVSQDQYMETFSAIDKLEPGLRLEAFALLSERIALKDAVLLLPLVSNLTLYYAKKRTEATQ